MQFARAVTLVMVVTLAGCSTGDETSRPVAQEAQSTPATADPVGPGGPLTTLPWDEVDLEGQLLGIEDHRNEECTTNTCVLGTFTVTDAVAAPPAGAQVPVADTRLVITEETRLFGCGPTDESVLITFDQFLRAPSEVIGEIPATVWTTGHVDGQLPDPAVAEQVVSGSCG